MGAALYSNEPKSMCAINNGVIVPSVSGKDNTEHELAEGCLTGTF